MEQTITFEIHKDTKAVQRELFEVPRSAKRLIFKVEVDADFALMGYLIIRDERRRIRFQKLLGYSERVIALGDSSENTTVGGVPGRIEGGEWELSLCIFTEYVKQFLGEESFSIQIQISDEDGEDVQIAETVGEECWVDSEEWMALDEASETGAHSECPLYYSHFQWNRIYGDAKRWYKGDFHTHTRLSDGKETVPGAMRKAKEMDMDFYVPTEHNVLHTGWVQTDVMVVPGVELTTEKGHCNLFGLDRMPERLPQILANMGEPEAEQYMLDAVAEANLRGWLVSLNHPFLHIWKWRHLSLPLSQVQMIEIINDPTYEYAPESNDKAIRFLDLLWQEGYRIYGVGGSDSHNLIEERYSGATEPSVAGDPGTYIFCDGLTPETLLRSVREGHAYVSRYCTLEIEILADGETYLPGAHIPVGEKERVAITYRVAVCGLKEKPVVYLVINRVRVELQVSGQEGFYEVCAQTEFFRGEYEWMRLEVRTGDGKFLAYINPVYHGAKTPGCRTYGEMLTKMVEMNED